MFLFFQVSTRNFSLHSWVIAPLHKMVFKTTNQKDQYNNKFTNFVEHNYLSTRLSFQSIGSIHRSNHDRMTKSYTAMFVERVIRSSSGLSVAYLNIRVQLRRPYGCSLKEACYYAIPIINFVLCCCCCWCCLVTNNSSLVCFIYDSSELNTVELNWNVCAEYFPRTHTEFQSN